MVERVPLSETHSGVPLNVNIQQDIAACLSGEKAMQAIVPSDDEFGEWEAIKLTPSGYPYEVREVLYVLLHEGDHLADMPHLVQLAVTSDITPPAVPDVLAEFSVELEAVDQGPNVISLSLDTPLNLTDGETLWVFVEMNGIVGQFVGFSKMALAHCPDTDWDPGAFWSQSTTTPYDWTPMSTFGLYEDPMVWARGTLYAEFGDVNYITK